MSPEARWPTRVFGKSFPGDDGVKHSREYILSRNLSTRSSSGEAEKDRGRVLLVRLVMEGRGRRGTSPLSRGRLKRSLRYPQGTQTVVVSGRVCGRGPARVQVVIDSL